MKTREKNLMRVRPVLAAFLMMSLLRLAPSQGLGELNATMSGMDTLNSSSTPSFNSGGFNPVNRARNAAGVPIPGDDSRRNAGNSGIGGDFNMPEAIVPKIKVITGTRIFDAITGELLDDAQEKEVPATDKESYYDDGTNGDIEPNNGQYTKVDINEGIYIGQSNQRVKERLVGALLVANSLNPLEFYGFNIMSTERHDAISRNRAWRLINDPNGGPGKVVAEIPIEEPQAVPNYRDKLQDKDQQVKEDWSYRFLHEYRTNKDSLTSEFYKMYIPFPPPAPSVRPPKPDHWIPFGDPMSLRNQIEEEAFESGRGGRSTGGGGQMGMMGMGGMAMNPAASSNYSSTTAR
jgi:hypothetical protein